VAPQRNIRSLQTKHAVQSEHIRRDPSPLNVKVFRALKHPHTVAVTLFVGAAAAYYFPAASDILFGGALGLTYWAMKQKEDMPLKMPIQSGLDDVNDVMVPGSKPSPGKGIFFFGNRWEDNKQLWITNDDCRQHFLVLGTTGSGKTENLLGFVTNALTWSSGFLFCDGKGDVSLFAKVFALSRRFGREDDLLVLNMMTGNADVAGGGGHLLSNTLNPFATGSSDGLTQLVVGLMDEVGGDGAMWKGRATAMFTGVMKAMVYLRNEGLLDLNVGAIRDHLNLRKIIDLSDPEKYPGLSEDVRHSIRSYLTSLPGYQEEKKYKQAQTTLDQHGYLEMQFTKILGSLADVYGHVFKTPYGEIDMQDVVLNRRILVVMLPALEKSSDELANLGKIVVATLKGMMGSALGNRIEGTWDDIVDNRVTNSPSPFLVVLDEVGYYTVEGLALMAAQARSLGFSMIYASQDIPAMKRLNEKEALSIIANTNVKIFMKTEEMEVTGKLAEEAGGTGIRAETGGYGGRIGEFGNAYSDNMEARFNAGVAMVDKLDLKDFGAGDMLVMFKAEKIFARTFHADPPKAVKVGRLKLRANHFVKIARPSRSEIESANSMTEVLKKLVSPDLPKEIAERDRIQRDSIPQAAESGEEIGILAKALREGLAAKVDPKEAACAAVFAVSYAIAGSAGKFAEHRTTHAVRPREELADAFPANPLDLDDDGFSDPRGAPPSRDAFDDYNPYPGQGGADDLDLDGIGDLGGRPREDAFDPLAGLDDAPERAPRAIPPRGPRRPSPVQDVEHVLTVDDRRLDASLRVDSNDSVLRVLADFDFDPSRTSGDDIEQRIHEATGAPTDPEGVHLAEPDYIDHTAWEADKAAEPATRPVAESSKGSHEEYISNILAELMEDDRD
jgi:intracellular multiplication protein IcmO